MLANLRALFAVVVDIVLLRRGPEHLPTSPALLAAVVVIYSLIAGLVAALMDSAGPRLIFEIAVMVGATLLWYWLALRLAKKPERFVQTLTAMFATRALLAPLDMPVRITVFAQVQAEVQTPTLLRMIFLFLLAWQLIVNVRIVRAAFEWPLPAIIILIIAQEFVVLLVVAALFGGAPSTPT